jgi:hypothetical protein
MKETKGKGLDSKKNMFKEFVSKDLEKVRMILSFRSLERILPEYHRSSPGSNGWWGGGWWVVGGMAEVEPRRSRIPITLPLCNRSFGEIGRFLIFRKCVFQKNTSAMKEKKGKGLDSKKISSKVFVSKGWKRGFSFRSL